MLDVEKLTSSTLDYSLQAALDVAKMDVWGWDEIAQKNGLWGDISVGERFFLKG